MELSTRYSIYNIQAYFANLQSFPSAVCFRQLVETLSLYFFLTGIRFISAKVSVYILKCLFFLALSMIFLFLFLLRNQMPLHFNLIVKFAEMTQYECFQTPTTLQTTSQITYNT